MSINADSEAYQALLEGHRAHPDDENIWEQLVQAKRRLEISWLEHTAR